MIPLGILASSVQRGSGELLAPTNLVATLVEPALYDPHWDKVVALLHFDGGFADETGRVWDQTGEFLTSGDEKVFGSASAYFPSTGLRGLTTPPTLDLNLGGDDFTVECWINPRIRNRQINICGLYAYSHNRRSWDFLYEPNQSDRIIFRMSPTGNIASSFIVAYEMPAEMLNKWTHVAVTRSGNVFRMFFDGVIVNQNSDSVVAFENLTDPFVFGTSGPNIVNSWDGYIDEFRITKGVARYTEDFTPTTEPFPNFGPPPEPTPLPTVIGEPYGGGFYAGDIEYPDGQWYKLIIADKTGSQNALTWKSTNTDTPNTRHEFDGLANTLACADAGIAEHPSADYCLSYSGGGEDDWYLPASNELTLIHLNLGYSQPNCPDNFKTGSDQAFDNALYWTSTEFSTTTSWMVAMSTGVLTGSNKITTGTVRWVRPVRRIAFTPD